MQRQDFHIKQNYRKRQTRLHNRKLYRQEARSLQPLYSAVLLFFVIGTYFNTLHNTKPAVQKLNVTQSTQAKTLKMPVFPLIQSMQVFAEEPRPTLIPVPVTNPNWEEFKSEARSIAKVYGFPINLLLAQAALESGHGTSNFALDRNNYFGIGAYDAMPNDAFSYENPEQAIIDYIYVVKNNFPQAWQYRDDAQAMLSLLENNNAGTQYASDPQYIMKVMNTPEWNE